MLIFLLNTVQWTFVPVRLVFDVKILACGEEYLWFGSHPGDVEPAGHCAAGGLQQAGPGAQVQVWRKCTRQRRGRVQADQHRYIRDRDSVRVEGVVLKPKISDGGFYRFRFLADLWGHIWTFPRMIFNTISRE